MLHEYNVGDDWPKRVDMILGGGGQDHGQSRVTDDLFARADVIRELAKDGVPMLMILVKRMLLMKPKIVY